ncbi:MAG: hypothetical protein ACRETX_02830 [Steroidobacteraceae bacterium]
MAFVWDPLNRSQSGMAQLLTRRLLIGSTGWRNAYEAEGVKVFTAAPRGAVREPCLLSDHAGIVLGTLFERALDGEPSARVTKLASAESAAIVSSGGRRLIDRYWGRYVAFLHDASADQTWIVRDPTGGLPCLTATIGGVQIYFSRLEDCAQLELLSFSVNWKYVAAHLAAPFTCAYETGINEVGEVLAGESVGVSREGIERDLCWHPLSPPEHGSTPRDVAARQCVHSWASCYGSIFCLRDDEHYAPLVRDLLRVAPNGPVVAFGAEPPHAPLEELLDAPRTESPDSYLGRVHATSTDLPAAWEIGAEAIFSATGAAALFHSERGTPADKALIDSQAYRELSLQPPPLHPWFSSAEVEPRRTFRRVQTLLAALRARNPLTQSEDPELVVPLLSQPLIEIAMRGGADLPPASAGTDHGERARAVLQQNVGLVRTYLLDGILVRERLLDRRRLESVLEQVAEGQPVQDSMAVELLDHFSTEAWLASWFDTGVRRQRERRVELML